MKQERTNLVGNHKIRNKLNKSEKMKSRKISTLKKHRTHSKSRNHERTSSSKLISKPINKMMAKTGSYDLTTSINSGNDVEEDVLNINDKIRLNSAEPIRDKTGGCESSSRNLYRFDNGFVKPDRRARNDEHSNNIPPASSSSPMFEFPKKKRFFGMPLTCFAYFAAIYSILAYGATSLLSLFEVMTNSSPRLIPLYILLVGYLLITLLTFVLIIAIQKELLNLILLWCIVMTVFILPEIGLNIMLAENTFNWFESTSGFYTLIALVVRVTLDVPCICLMLIYHHDRCKRVSLLRKIMMPLRKNISSGEILRSYNDIDQRQSVLKPPNMPPVPPAYKPERRESSRGSANAIGFEKISGENGTRNQDETLNRVHYKFAPNKHNYEIILRPSQTGEFVQKFVNIDDVKFGRDEELTMSEVPQKTHARKPLPRITPTKDKEDALDGNTMIKKNENKHYILNDNEFKEKYINEITKKSRMINLANHQIYLPPMISSSSSLINNPKLANNFLPLNSESVNLDLTNDTSIDLNNNDSRAEYQSAALNVSPSCECVNIVSCDKDEASEFLHSQNCHMKAQQQPANIGFGAPSSLFMFTQRKHF